MTAQTAALREIALGPAERDIPGIVEGHRVSDTVIRMYSKHNRRETRLAVSYIPADGLGRRTNGGPILPGPYASTFGLGTVIDNFGGTAKESADMTAAGKEFETVEGDRFLMDGIVWEIRDDVPLGYPRLYPVETGE